jgi:hypothetical protein
MASAFTKKHQFPCKRKAWMMDFNAIFAPLPRKGLHQTPRVCQTQFPHEKPPLPMPQRSMAQQPALLR